MTRIVMLFLIKANNNIITIVFITAILKSRYSEIFILDFSTALFLVVLSCSFIITQLIKFIGISKIYTLNYIIKSLDNFYSLSKGSFKEKEKNKYFYIEFLRLRIIIIKIGVPTTNPKNTSVPIMNSVGIDTKIPPWVLFTGPISGSSGSFGLTPSAI